MPRRLLITFESPVPVRSQQITPISPDWALVQLDHVPTSPGLLSANNQNGSPSVAKMILPRLQLQDFGYEQHIRQILLQYPLLLCGFHCLVNNTQLPAEVTTSLFAFNGQKFTFDEALKQLFLNAPGRAVYGIANAVYGVDLFTPMHRNLLHMQQFIKNNTINKQQIHRQFNYAPPDILLGQGRPALQQPLDFRLSLLQSSANDGLLDERMSRFYSLRELTMCGVDLADLVDQQDLASVSRLFKNKQSPQNMLRVAGGSGEGKYLINNLVVPEQIKHEQIIVFAVTTADNQAETILQEPCGVDEFNTYRFEESDAGEYDVHLIFNLKPVRNILIQTLEQQSGLRRGRRRQTSGSDSWSGRFSAANSESAAHVVTERKSRRNSRSAAQTNRQEIVNNANMSQHQFPDIFVHNFNCYLNNYLLKYNHSAPSDQQLAINYYLHNSTSLSVEDRAYVNGGSCRKFWAHIKTITRMLETQQGRIDYGGVICTQIARQYNQRLLQGLNDDIKEYGEKVRLSVLFTNPTSLYIAQGHYGRAFQIINSARCIVDAVHLRVFNIDMYVRSMFMMLRGINQVLYHRLQVQLQLSYIKLGETNQLIPTFYNAWGFTSIYGVGLIQLFCKKNGGSQEQLCRTKQPFSYIKCNSSIAVAESDEDTNEEELDELDMVPPKGIVEFMQYQIRFRFNNVGDPPVSQIPRQNITYLVQKQIKIIEDKGKPREFVDYDGNAVEDFTESGDYVYGLPFYPPRNSTIPASRTPLNEDWPETDIQHVAIDEYQPDVLHRQMSQQVIDSVQGQSAQIEISDSVLDLIIDLAQTPTISPLRLLQATDSFVYTAPTNHSSADMQIVGTFARLVEKMKEAKYNVQNLVDIVQSTTDRDHQQLVQDEPSSINTSIYNLQMLQSENNEKVSYITQQFEVDIPKFLLNKKIKYVSDFVQQYTLQQLKAMGFNIVDLVLFADMQKYSMFYQPGIVFDSLRRRYQYMPLVLNTVLAQQSITKQYNVDLYQQAVRLQSNLLKHAFMPQKNIQFSILSLLDITTLPKKFANHLQDHIKMGYSADFVMGVIGQQLLDAYTYESKIHDLLGLEEGQKMIINLNIDETDENDETRRNRTARTQNRQVDVVSRDIVDLIEQEREDTVLYRFILECYEELDHRLSNSAATVPLDVLQYLDEQDNYIQMVNGNKRFMLGQATAFNNFDVEAVRQAYASYTSVVEPCCMECHTLRLSGLLRSAALTANTYDLRFRQPYKPVNFVVAARYRGLRVAHGLLHGRLSPDDAIVQSTKHHGFVSVAETFRSYRALLDTLQQAQNEKMTPQQLAGRFAQACASCEVPQQIGEAESYLIPHNLHLLGDLRLYQGKTKILTPLFRTYDEPTARGQQPLVDVYGRVLRQQAPYLFKTTNTVPNEPAPLEHEAPPPPAAAGEEATMQPLIDFWENVKNRFFCIPDERIRAIRSPLYCLEEREVEFLTPKSEAVASVEQQDKRDRIESGTLAVSCQCKSTAAILYPNPNSNVVQLEPFQKGIYYVNPYYIPPNNQFELERVKIYKQLAKHAISCIIQHIKTIIQEQVLGGHSNFDIDTQGRMQPAISIFFLQAWPAQFPAEHLREGITEQQYNEVKSTNCELADKLSAKPKHENINHITNCQLLNRIKMSSVSSMQIAERFTQVLRQYYTQSLVDICADLQELLLYIIQKNQILNLLRYSDPKDASFVMPTAVVSYLSQNKLTGSVVQGEKVLNDYLNSRGGQADEILKELVEKQRQLKILEEENLRQNIELSHRLQLLKYEDIKNETAELFATTVNAAWGKICAGDKAANCGKLGYDQLALGGFETNGPTGDFSISKELDEMARQNELDFGQWCWEKDTFDIQDVVDFE